MTRFAIAALCLMTAMPAALAQPSANPAQPPSREAVTGSFADTARKQAAPMRISLGMNFVLTGISDPISDDAKLRERTRRHLYEMAVKECELLTQTIASECRIETVNINLARNPQSAESFNVNAGIVLRAVQKSSAP